MSDEFNTFDEQMMGLAAGANSVHMVYKSYLDAGFNPEQAFDLTKHIMELGMREGLAQKLEQMRIQAAVKANQPILNRFLNL